MNQRFIGAVAFTPALLIPEVSAVAQPAPPREIIANIESTIVDTHATWIGMNFGDEGGEPLVYTSVVRDDGWEGTLRGDYLGRDIHVAYEGSFVPDPQNASAYVIDWTSDWMIDGLSYFETGSGGLEPTRSSFRVTINSSGAVGASGTVGSWVGNITVSAEKNLAEQTLRASVRAALLDVPAVGSLADATASFTLYQVDGRFESVFFTTYFFGVFEKTIATNSGYLIDQGDGTSVNTQTVTLTPAPPTAAVLVGLALGASCRRRSPIA